MTHSIFDFRPQIVDPVFGTEPSIHELLMRYYTENNVPVKFAEQFTQEYLKSLLAKMDSTDNFSLYISGPNACAGFTPNNNITLETKRAAWEIIINALSILTGDDTTDYTVTST